MSSRPSFPLIPLAHLGPVAEPERKYRLMEVVRRRARERRYSPRTERAYVLWIRRYILHHGRRHPRELDADAVEVGVGRELHLGQAGDAGADQQAGAVVGNRLFELRDELGAFRARADHAHVAAQDVPQLREFVE